ncbi:MAG: ATP-binding protein [Christensenellaceae bacterium]|jgi:DNA replication protein DnaC
MPSKSVADLFSEFTLSKKQKRLANEQRIGAHPQIALIDEQIRILLLQKLDQEVNNKDASQTDQSLAALTHEKQTLIDREVSLIPASCSTCHDTGVVNGGYCTCFLQEVYKSLYSAIDIKKISHTFQAFDASIFDAATPLPTGKTQREHMELIRQVCEDFTADFSGAAKRGLLLLGNTGLGKTYLLECMAKEAYARGTDVLFIRAGDLFRTFFAHRMGEDIPLSFLYDARLLLLDDLGTEPPTQNVTAEYLYELIDKRQGKPTVIASNLKTSSDIVGRYNERIASRLKSKQHYLQLVFEGKDVRK